VLPVEGLTIVGNNTTC